MKTALIIEDEIPAGNRLKKLLEDNDYIVLTQLYSVESASYWLKENNHPDLILMDIQLRDGKCFEILDRVQVNSKIVFTTAYDEFALKTFEYNTIDYLLKPIDENKFSKMITKINSLNPSFNHHNIKTLSDNFTPEYRTSCLVNTGNSLKKIYVSEIIGFMSENNITYIITDKNRQFYINSSLEKLETELDPKLFLRVNRKFILNKNFILGLEDKFKIKIEGFSEYIEIKLSRLKYKAFIDWYSF